MQPWKKESGVLSLEASICLILFIFLMLFMYSFFVTFEARNMMAHAALSTADSMALDVYKTDKLTGSDDLAAFFATMINSVTGDSMYVSDSKWYTLNEYSTDWNENIYAGVGSDDDDDYQDDYGNRAYVSSEFADVVRQRFLAYLAGSENKADVEQILKRYHIVGGADGLDFSKSRIVGGNLFVVVSYRMDYEYDVINVVKMTLEQSACSKLWK